VSILAIVTSRAVYHWKMEGSDQPTLIFSRTGPLAEQNTQIINYCADSQQIWCCLIGISTPDGGQTIVGNM